MYVEQNFLGQNSSDRPALSSDNSFHGYGNHASQSISSTIAAGQLAT